MRPFAMNSINALVKWGGAASLKDAAGQAEIRGKVIALRNKTLAGARRVGLPGHPVADEFLHGQPPTSARCSR